MNNGPPGPPTTAVGQWMERGVIGWHIDATKLSMQYEKIASTKHPFASTHVETDGSHVFVVWYC
jgi:hypothetical protein